MILNVQHIQNSTIIIKKSFLLLLLSLRLISCKGHHFGHDNWIEGWFDWQFDLFDSLYLLHLRREAKQWHFRIDLACSVELESDYLLGSDGSGMQVLLHHPLLVLGQILGSSHFLGQLPHLLLVDHDSKGVVRRVDIFIDTVVSLAAAVQAEMRDLARHQVHVLDVDAEALELRDIGDLVLGGEELDEPAVDETAGLVGLSVGLSPLEVEVVPELQMGVSLEGLGELGENGLEAADVTLESAVHIELLQVAQLILQLLPVLEGASHVHVDDAAASAHARVVEVLLAGVHHQCGREHGFEEASGGEVALELLHYSLDCVLLDLLDDSLHKWHPILQISVGLNLQLLLAGVRNEGLPQLFGVVVDVLGEPEHDDHPDLIGFQFEVAVLHVGLVEGLEEAVVAAVAQRGVLHVGVDLAVLPLLPQIRARQVFIGFVCRLPAEALDGNGPVARIGLLELRLLWLGVRLLGVEFPPDLIEEGHGQGNTNEWR